MNEVEIRKPVRTHQMNPIQSCRYVLPTRKSSHCDAEKKGGTASVKGVNRKKSKGGFSRDDDLCFTAILI